MVDANDIRRGGAVAALFRVPLLEVISSWSSLGLLAAVLGCVLAGVLLHSEGQLEFLQFRWQIDQLAIAPSVTHRWRRTTWLLACGAIVLALLLGGAVRFVPPLPPLIPVLNVLLAVLMLLTWLVVALVSLVLLPFAWLIGLLRGDETATPAQRFMPPPLPPIEQTCERASAAASVDLLGLRGAAAGIGGVALCAAALRRGGVVGALAWLALDHGAMAARCG
jgi:hypothetical protein